LRHVETPCRRGRIGGTRVLDDTQARAGLIARDDLALVAGPGDSLRNLACGLRGVETGGNVDQPDIAGVEFVHRATAEGRKGRLRRPRCAIALRMSAHCQDPERRRSCPALEQRFQRDRTVDDDVLRVALRKSARREEQRGRLPLAFAWRKPCDLVAKRTLLSG
jgi:hypothetical protein